MRHLAVLILATLVSFSVEVVHSQTPQDQPRAKAPTASDKAKDAEKAPLQANQQNPFDAFQQFSAEMSGGPTQFDKKKIARLGNKLRAEWDYEHEIRISDLATHRLSYIRRMPKKPVECGIGEKIDMAAYPFFFYTGSDFTVKRSPAEEPAEKETIDGHPTKAENYTVTNNSDGTITAKLKLWEAEDLQGFPVRMEIDPPRTKKFTLDYTNVSLDKPDPKLFTIPAHCPATKPSVKGKTKTTFSVPATSKPDSKPSSPPQ